MRVATCQRHCAHVSLEQVASGLRDPDHPAFVLFKTFARLSGPGGCNSLVECSKKCSFSWNTTNKLSAIKVFPWGNLNLFYVVLSCVFIFLVVFFWCGYHDVARFSRQRPVRGDSQLQRKISALVIFRFTYFYIELYTLRIRVGKHLLNKYDGHYFYSAQISSFKRAEHSLVVRNPTSDNLGL